MKTLLTKVAKFIAYFSFFLPVTNIAHAQSGRGVDAGLTRIQGEGLFSQEGISGATTASGLIIAIINYMLIFAGIIAVAFIIIGGYWYITSAGNEEQAEKGKNTLLNAIIGVVVVVLSYVMVRVVTNLVSRSAI